MLKGLLPSAYTVLIGDSVCGNIDVQDNVITCEPPTTRPQVSAGDYVGNNKIPVKVSIIGTTEHLYTFKYRNNS